MKINKHATKTRRRQWGTETRTEPLPRIHEYPSVKKISLSRIAIILTIGLWILYFISTIIRQFIDGPKTFEFRMQATEYLIVVTFLNFSALMYLLARQGALQRFSQHLRVPRSQLDEYFSKHKPAITVLIPSYSEETHVIRMTMLSAAFQEYPKMRVVLLIDDPPQQATKEGQMRLDATRSLAKEIIDLFAPPRKRLHKAKAEFERKYIDKMKVNIEDIQDLITQYHWVIAWLEELASHEPQDDHVDIFFVEQVLRGLAKELQHVADALSASSSEETRLSVKRVRQLYNRLIWIFDTDLEVFERKQYASLSHEANKAMNLNSYIGLMGGVYRPKSTPAGTILTPTNNPRPGDIAIPDSEFLLTLDADSVLLREYCLRLVYFLEQPDNAHVAVTQTPYSSFRGAQTRIERLAGATTDIQHILHQGLTQYNATFWVGANAVIRKEALEDIVETTWVGGFPIYRFIQDRTVIEDTESTIDLTLHGWQLINYPERLSYSATPPDFGSLIVQRRRWANGGLLILPKYIRQIRERKRNGEYVSPLEAMLRINYMASIAWASFGLIFLLAFPYDSTLLSPLILLSALPYFFAMASDLKYCGYKRSDVIRIYGFNLMLLPVNLAGVLKSLQQAITGTKIPFARTPKVKDRTVAPMLYIIAPLLIIAFSLFTLYRDQIAHNWGNAAFAGFNAILTTWAVLAYIGIKHGIADTWRGIINWFFIEVDDTRSTKETIKVEPNWQSVLYYGNAEDQEQLAQSPYSPYPIYSDSKGEAS